MDCSSVAVEENNDCPRFVDIDALSCIVLTEGLDVVARCNNIDTNHEEKDGKIDGNVVVVTAEKKHDPEEENEMETYSPPSKQKKKRGRKPKSKGRSLGQICDSDNEEQGRVQLLRGAKC